MWKPSGAVVMAFVRAVISSLARRAVSGASVGANGAAAERLPVVGKGVQFRLVFGLAGCLLVVEERLLDALDFRGGIDAKLVGVDLKERRMVLDDGVAARRGDRGVVDFGVSVTAIADEIDDDVGLEGMAIFDGKRCDAHDGFGVFRVDVEDGKWAGAWQGSVAKRELLDSSGTAVKPSRLLVMIWSAPPTL